MVSISSDLCHKNMLLESLTILLIITIEIHSARICLQNTAGIFNPKARV